MKKPPDQYLQSALKRWPNVPACYGWLLFDQRGRWWMRDETAQLQGDRGSLIEHAGLKTFIESCYRSDALGAWYLQNGPQKVFVELECAPLVARLDRDQNGLTMTSTFGQTLRAREWFTDEFDRVYFSTGVPFELAVVHSMDVGVLADEMEQRVSIRPQARTLQAICDSVGVCRSPAQANLRPR